MMVILGGVGAYHLKRWGNAHGEWGACIGRIWGDNEVLKVPGKHRPY